MGGQFGFEQRSLVVTIFNLCMLCLVDFNSRPLIPLLGSANPFPSPLLAPLPC